MKANDLIEDAIKAGASDIHIEPEDGFYSAFLRIDGELSFSHTGSLEEYAAMVCDLKERAGLTNRNDSSVLDGQFMINSDNSDFDVRMATLPVRRGEFVCMRILRPPMSLAA